MIMTILFYYLLGSFLAVSIGVVICLAEEKEIRVEHLSLLGLCALLSYIAFGAGLVFYMQHLIEEYEDRVIFSFKKKDKNDEV